MAVRKIDPEQGGSRPPPISDPRRDSQRSSDDRPYWNYHPPFALIILEFLTLLFLGLVCFLPPSGSGGLSSIVKSDTEYIGVLKTCSDTVCQAYMAATTSSSSSSSKRSHATLAARNSLSSSIDLSNLFLTTGLAALAAFWIMLYFFLLTVYRYFTDIPPSPTEEEPRKKSMWDIRNGLKRFAYRVCRIYVVVEAVLVLGVACAAAWSYNQGREAGGSLGMGVLLLHACWPMLGACAFIELASGRWRKRIDLGWCGCTCLGIFTKAEKRARRKWKTSVDDDPRGRSRTRSRSRQRPTRKV